jgi:hypothetical protein
MIKTIKEAFKTNITYAIIVALIMAWFGYNSFTGQAYFQSSGVQRNAGYAGPIPHSGYGARFYHK